MNEIKLKPCSFCGSDAEMQQGKYQGLRTFYVSCLGCGARTDLEYAEEFAADLWNERVEPNGDSTATSTAPTADGQIWEHIGFGDMLAYEAVHCPKCGAIIERRA